MRSLLAYRNLIVEEAALKAIRLLFRLVMEVRTRNGSFSKLRLVFRVSPFLASISFQTLEDERPRIPES